MTRPSAPVESDDLRSRTFARRARRHPRAAEVCVSRRCAHAQRLVMGDRSRQRRSPTSSLPVDDRSVRVAPLHPPRRRPLRRRSRIFTRRVAEASREGPRPLPDASRIPPPKVADLHPTDRRPLQRRSQTFAEGSSTRRGRSAGMPRTTRVSPSEAAGAAEAAEVRAASAGPSRRTFPRCDRRGARGRTAPNHPARTRTRRRRTAARGRTRGRGR